MHRFGSVVYKILAKSKFYLYLKKIKQNCGINDIYFLLFSKTTKSLSLLKTENDFSNDNEF